MTTDVEFTGFPKISRLSRDMIVTEKIDGTNAQIYIDEDGKLLAGSRKRWIEPGDDNYGFAAWVQEHRDELLELGPGRHFGEWWGKGIQRGYGLEEKRFSLFNVSRWAGEECPACCHVVPILCWGDFNLNMIEVELDSLEKRGSVAAPGFMNPEGVVIYHVAGNVLFKKTIKNDEKPKGAIE